MPRRKAHSLVTASAGEPPVIHPTAVYTPAQVRQLLGLRESSLRTAKRETGLVCCRRGGHDYYLGEDVLDWLRRGRCSRDGTNGVEGAPSPAVRED